MTEPTDKRPLDEADEQQLEQYLKGDSSVSRQYRELPGAEVPASLDRLVLSQAQDAVKNRSSQRPAWVRWSAPFAVAASAVLALAIVIETGLRDETTVSVAMQERPIETRMIEESAPANVPVQSDSERPALESPASESRASDRYEPPAVEMRMPELPKTEDVAMPPIAAPAPAAPSVRTHGEPSIPAPAAPSVPAPAARSIAPPPVAFPKRSVANDAADTSIQEQVAKAAQGDAEASAGAAAREEENVAAQRAMQDEQSLAAASRELVDTRAPVAVYSRTISADMSDASPRTYLDPEEWLKDIRQLRKENKQEQADLEWRRFRAAYPNHEVAETDAARETKK